MLLKQSEWSTEKDNLEPKLIVSMKFLNNKQESQIPTQRYGRRPFGVGLLVAGYDVSTVVWSLSFLSCQAAVFDFL